MADLTKQAENTVDDLADRNVDSTGACYFVLNNTKDF